MTPGERWLTATWPVVHARLPAAPARVVEVGCGPLGGFVPMLRANRYDAVGIDQGWEKFDQQQRNGASNASDQTAKPAGSIADGTNGSPRATSGRATCAAGRSAKGCIPARCWSACWTSGSSAGS